MCDSKGHSRQYRRVPLARAAAAGAILLIGLLMATYPATADWFAQREHRSASLAYQQTVAQLPEGERSDVLEAAEDYNRSKGARSLADPFGDDSASESVQQYIDQLNVGSDSPMAQLTMPELNIDLPIYHGVSDTVLRTGIGHLPGSDLPVGGTGTRSVLTSHSGLQSAALFTPLHHATVGMTIQISTFGRVLTYKVTDIQTIDPDRIDLLEADPNQDMISLITCTPIGINTQRLVVNAERVATTDDATTLDVPEVSFPWWLVIDLIGATAVVLTAARIAIHDRRNFARLNTPTGADNTAPLSERATHRRSNRLPRRGRPGRDRRYHRSARRGRRLN